MFLNSFSKCRKLSANFCVYVADVIVAQHFIWESVTFICDVTRQKRKSVHLIIFESFCLQVRDVPSLSTWLDKGCASHYFYIWLDMQYAHIPTGILAPIISRQNAKSTKTQLQKNRKFIRYLNGDLNSEQNVHDLVRGSNWNITGHLNRRYVKVCDLKGS